MLDSLTKDIGKVAHDIIKLHFMKCQCELSKLNLYPGQERLLYYIRKKDGLSQKELCEKLNVKPSTIAVMLKRMEKTGLFERVQDENDKRITRIFITDKGKDISDEIIKIHETFGKICFNNVSEEEKIILKRILMQVRDNLKTEVNEEDIHDFKCMFKNKI